MKLSLVIPAYNEALRLPESLDELLDFVTQKSKHLKLDQLELIVSNDGSSDATTEVARSYQAKFPFMKVVGLNHHSLTHAF